MKTWLEYINEEAAKYGLEFGRLVDMNGQFFHYRALRHGEPIMLDQFTTLGFQSKEEVEAFIRGVWWARSGD